MAQVDTAHVRTAPFHKVRIEHVSAQDTSPDESSNGDGASVEISMEALVREHHRSVFGYAFRLSGSVDDAEDLTQQAYLQAQQNLAQLEDAAKARPWLLTIARNLYLKAYRRRKTSTAGDLEMDFDTLPGDSGLELDASDVDGEALAHALDELPEGFRVVVVMFYFEQASYREIAAALELPTGTIMSRLSRAKRMLRSKLTKIDPAGTSSDKSNATRY